MISILLGFLTEILNNSKVVFCFVHICKTLHHFSPILTYLRPSFYICTIEVSIIRKVRLIMLP